MKRMGGETVQDSVIPSNYTLGLVSNLYGSTSHFVLRQELEDIEDFCIHLHVSFLFSLIHFSIIPQP